MPFLTRNYTSNKRRIIIKANFNYFDLIRINGFFGNRNFGHFKISFNAFLKYIDFAKYKDTLLFVFAFCRKKHAFGIFLLNSAHDC